MNGNVEKISLNITQRLKLVSHGDSFHHEDEEIRVRPVRTSQEMKEVYRIVHDAYLEKGYIKEQPHGKLIHYPHLDGIPETTVLVALDNCKVIGTNSVTFDGLYGMHVDEDFREECNQIRLENRMLAASWRIATRKSCRNVRKVVMKLIQKTVDHALMNGVETMLFTFNPRHERIYKRLLNMTTIARDDESVAGLSNAPAVLMRVDKENLPDRWLKTSEQRGHKEPAAVF
ncbi:hypothetical protein Dvar_52740 [Desulfosarcina variabilis str. Montpellier]|uniref:N-acyl amino acid synthase FeeM domain-containing protein n=1 Tax=Desulfosarcina variabilis TaxID=2300 RepID=UPI003AFB0395